MSALRAFLKRHPVSAYFALVFAISWGGDLIVVGPGGLPGTSAQIERLFPVAILAMLAGPSVAGVLMTGVVHGRTGIRALLSRLLARRVGARWYAFALLTIPLVATALLAALSLASPVFRPDIVTTDGKAGLLLTGIAVGLVGGFFEELGWTGFAVPALRARHGMLTTGLIVGAVWGAWHFPMTFWASGDASGALSLPQFLPAILFYVAVLPVVRVLMVWVYDHTNSLLLAILMHASLIVSTLFVLVPEAAGAALVAYYLVLAATLWGVVAVAAVADSRHRSRPSLRWRAA